MHAATRRPNYRPNHHRRAHLFAPRIGKFLTNKHLEFLPTHAARCLLHSTAIRLVYPYIISNALFLSAARALTQFHGSEVAPEYRLKCFSFWREFRALQQYVYTEVYTLQFAHCATQPLVKTVCSIIYNLTLNVRGAMRFFWLIAIAIYLGFELFGDQGEARYMRKRKRLTFCART